MIVVDTSAIMSVLLEEPDAERLLRIMVNEDRLLMAAGTFVECHYVVFGKFAEEGRVLLDGLVERLDMGICPMDDVVSRAAIDARYRYGKGTGHPANLNFGDCFSYALARTRDLPLLFKGDDFVHTDIRSATPEA